jgi:hypothetical protein
MGSVHGLSSVQNALEPTGTFNGKRSTRNVQRETFSGKPTAINLSTINRFM